jgi:Haemolysin XhlA
MTQAQAVQYKCECEGRVTSLEIKVAVMESDIKNVKEDIGSIKDDTKWLRRAITNALIVGGITLIGGVITTVIIFLMKGGTIS